MRFVLYQVILLRSALASASYISAIYRVDSNLQKVLIFAGCNRWLF